jgi:uncharacterized protein YdaU (DUF1376 family)
MARKPDSLHVLPLFCDDLIASCVDMTPACFGAYMRLLCFAWTRGGLPDNEAACSRIAGGLDTDDWQQIRQRLTVLGDGRLSHDRLERERVAVSDIREERAKAGSAGGRAKAANVANGKQTPSKPVANALANGWQTPSKSVAPNPNPNPYPSHTEELQPAAPVPTSKPQAAASRAKSAVSWSADDGWAGITDTDRSEWAEAYPGAVLAQELAKATAWLKANPSRAGRRNWRRFIVGWLQRCQDKGGTNREPGRRPDEKPPPKAWKDEYSPATYRRPKEVAALATTLKLKEEDT